jgi:hypothetical protein
LISHGTPVAQALDDTPIYKCVTELSRNSATTPGPLGLNELNALGPVCKSIFQIESSNRLAQITSYTYETQRKNGIYILLLVVGITLFGLVLATFQLYWGYRLAILNRGALTLRDGAPPQEGGNNTGLPQVTQAKFSKDGFEISSSVVGLIVLAFSLAFFITYVWKVYPIQTP